MNEFEFDGNDENENFTLAYDKIVKTRTMMPITRMLAYDLMTQGYMSVGDFIKNLSDNDVQNLLEISEDEESEKFSELCLMAEMLAGGEGLTSFEGGGSKRGIKSFTLRINTLCGFITVESLRRKNLVKVYHENMSFGAEMGSKVIVERLKGD